MNHSLKFAVLFLLGEFFLLQSCNNNSPSPTPNSCDTTMHQHPAALGINQSPIDITLTTKISGNCVNNLFQYVTNEARFIFDTADANMEHEPNINGVPNPINNLNFVTFRGKTYFLNQFHFHNPAEHRIDGTLDSMEMHLVYKDVNGNGIVIARMFVADRNNPNSPDLELLFRKIAERAACTSTKCDVNGVFKLSSFIPPNLDAAPYYTYTGSLTTPPYQEGITWVVLQEPMKISLNDYAMFKSIDYKGQKIGKSRKTFDVANRVVLEVDQH